MLRKFLVIAFACILVFIVLSPVFSALEENVRVDVIEIWVKVTDKNNRPVSDLGPQDFSIYIDNKKMETRCFDKTFESKAPQGEVNVNGAIKRRFIFYFDLLNSSASDIEYLKSKMTDFLATSFTPEDEGMVFVLLPNVHLGVVQKMTNNKEALIDVVGKMKGNPTIATKTRNNEKELLNLLYSFENPGGQSPERRSQPDLVRQARALAENYAAQEQNLSRFTLNSFLSIASYLQGARYDGRLVMIYVSGGFPLHPGQNYFQIVDRALDESNEFGSNEIGFREHPEYDFDKDVRNTLGLLNRLNVTIYSVDCGGLVDNDRGADRDSRQNLRGSDTVAYSKELQDSLVTVARETGGLVFTNSQNYAKGLAEISTDLGQQYWLCSNAPASKKAGTYHKIEVKVARGDLKVRHRQGYVD